PKAQGSDGSGIFIEPAEHYAGFAWSGEFFFSFWGETDQILEAGHKAFAHTTGGRAAQFETTPCSHGGGVVGESLPSEYLLVGCLLCRAVPLIVGHLLLIVALAGGGESGLRFFIRDCRLRPDQSLRPVLVESAVHLILSVKALESRRFGRSMGLRVILRHLVGGQPIGTHHLLLAGREISAHGAVVLDAVDIRHQ